MALTAPPRPLGPTVWDGVSLWRSPGRAPVAVGGTLDPPTLIGAYRAGAFPWPSDDDQDADGKDADGKNGEVTNGEGSGTGVAVRLRDLLRAAVAARRVLHLSPERPGGYDLPWWSPDPRAVIPAGGVRVNRSLRKRLRNCGWTTTVDEAFVDVVRGCQRGGTSGWITDELIDGYAELHALGWAHSVEVWDGDDLVGGVYGVGVGGVFAGESMFHTRTDGSKVALADFDARFAAAGGVLLDVQMTTDHLLSLGAREVPRRDYLEVLERVRDVDVRLERDRHPVSRLAPPDA
ncbi:Leucyl/phenylalanyl-tRNA--protein transferase [Frankia canadensis]|uniref:Leucyl/phenylalanyl-tRNA--protein transferase n=1 Tax=Frankia canadensis TaxID=1836972 RepID=A0A2I2KIJ7_9ACTN|nr:leucyl/phenylalanyl-tRNA--protein transferase [Frankia canadensis]SNQ45483.1 Leucyl/phenylalanyl-tRNA--protein transferase [Frankia canadensis]SOU52773.1 Leucyl/phenylalanyl-tRNA--protein transferase [Frankia canadensis]